MLTCPKCDTDFPYLPENKWAKTCPDCGATLITADRYYDPNTLEPVSKEIFEHFWEQCLKEESLDPLRPYLTEYISL